MNLMLIFRKYNMKIMAVVVIALMIVFILQPVMDYFSRTRTGGGKIIATYGNGKKISREDIEAANQQIEILKNIGIETILRPQDPRMASNQDLRIILLGELIFPERTSAVETIGRIRQLVNTDGYAVSDKQVNELYGKQYPPSIYWILLNREASEAGIKTPAEQTKNQLQMLLPRMNRGASYEQVIMAIEKQNRVSEAQVIEAFSSMTTIIDYCRVICATENRTLQQVLDQTNFREETIDVNYVVVDAATFANELFKPSADKVAEQFDKYKGDFAGDIREDNPYGFGYKQPERVSLEYISVRLDDVAATVKPLTQQETEEFYQQHSKQPPITYQAYSDPNDPNSEIVLKTRSYAEVASAISKQLYRQRVDSKAEKILADAKSMTEAGLSGMDVEQGKLTDEQFKKASVDYEKVANELTEKYKVKIYAGRTGLLSASDMQNDRNLGSLYFGGAGVTDASLTRVVFAVAQLKTSELGSMDTRAPRLYENIGPLKDAREGTGDYAGKNMALTRIVAAEKAAEPKSIDEKIDKHGIQFDDQKSAEDSNTVKNIVVEDLKRLAAMNKAGSMAQEFVAMATKDGWDSAIGKFNDLYGKSKGDVNKISHDEKPFKMSRRTGLRRVSELDIADIKVRTEGNPTAEMIVNRVKGEGMLVDKMYALLPADSNTLTNPAILEFKPGMRYFCIEDMTIHRLYQEVFDMTKAGEVVRDEFAEAQPLAFVYYNPKNIIKRMNYVQLQDRQEVNEPNTAAADSNRTGK